MTPTADRLEVAAAALAHLDAVLAAIRAGHLSATPAEHDRLTGAAHALRVLTGRAERGGPGM